MGCVLTASASTQFTIFVQTNVHGRTSVAPTSGTPFILIATIGTTARILHIECASVKSEGSGRRAILTKGDNYVKYRPELIAVSSWRRLATMERTFFPADCVLLEATLGHLPAVHHHAGRRAPS